LLIFSTVFQAISAGREFRIRTDHSALTWLKHTPEPVGQQAKWLEIMEDFCFTIDYRPGEKHANADALSRRPCSIRDCLCRKSANLATKEEFVELGSLTKSEKNELIIQKVRVTKQRGNNKEDSRASDNVADQQNVASGIQGEATPNVLQLSIGSADNEVSQSEVELSPW